MGELLLLLTDRMARFLVSALVANIPTHECHVVTLSIACPIIKSLFDQHGGRLCFI